MFLRHKLFEWKNVMNSVADKADIPARASRVIVTRVTTANRTVCVPVIREVIH